jgi:hypothetical protein
MSRGAAVLPARLAAAAACLPIAQGHLPAKNAGVVAARIKTAATEREETRCFDPRCREFRGCLPRQRLR